MSTKRRRINDVFIDIPAADLLNACNKNIRMSNETNPESNDSNNNESFD